MIKVPPYVYVGLKFTSIWFKNPAVCEVLSIEIPTNIMKVRITRSLEHWHEENWNLEHAIWGFKNADYHSIKNEQA